MKSKSSAKKPSVAVRDLTAKKNPKGGGLLLPAVMSKGKRALRGGGGVDTVEAG